MKTLPILRVLGQIHSTYIIAEGPEGMYLIDQHAAHERILFEKTIKRDDSSSAHIQSLLEPVTVELSVDQSDLLDRHIDTMAKLGFIVEDFSNRVYILRSSPSMLKTGNPGQELMDVLDLFNEGGGYESWKERAAYSIACHGAIRAGKVLSSQEMNELTQDLENCDQPHTCPHGRPTMIHITNSRLESEFGRT
jgi:DNA mismatch repair protein MutL